jgi:hypothetical protein
MLENQSDSRNSAASNGGSHKSSERSNVSYSTCRDPVTLSFQHDERVIADDRRWFAGHPRRSHRIRPPGIGERQTMRGQYPEMRCYVVVRQTEPGVRLRQPAWLTGRVPNLEPIAHAVFDLVLAAARGGQDFIPPDVVRQRLMMLAGVGAA